MGFYPFDHPNIFDGKYKFLMKKDFGNFWKKNEKLTNFGEISGNFKNLFEKMVCYDPKERLTLEEVKKHPWLLEINNNNLTNYEESYKSEETYYINKKQTKLSNKIKNSKDFNKEENFGNNNKIFVSQSEINSQNPVLKNIISNEENNKNKDIEIKYFKEFSNWKKIIDKIIEGNDH